MSRYFSTQLDNYYDVVIVGAGPAGSMAAWYAARNNVKVLLLEKDREVGIPVRCAEAVAKQDLESLIEHSAPPSWVASEILKFRLFAPNGTPVYIDIGETGYILHRRLFDYDLALKAANAGACLVTNAAVIGVIKREGTIAGVKVTVDGHVQDIKSLVVVAADGVESRVARWSGIDSTIPFKKMETCVQYTLTDIPIDTDTCDFYFSQNFAPGGYAWVFPKGKKTANVGLGIAGNYARQKSPELYLEIFLKKYFPKASISSRTVGGVPTNKPMKNIVSDGIMIVGDAAHQANPLSGGGIISAMVAGQISGQVAAKAVKKKKVTKKDLLPYALEWHKRVGKDYQRFFRLKEALVKFEDRHFNDIAAEYLKLDKNKQNLLSVFTLAFKHNPAFLLDVIRLFASFKK